MGKGLTAHQLKERTRKQESTRRRELRRKQRLVARADGATIPQEKDRWPENWPAKAVLDQLSRIV